MYVSLRLLVIAQSRQALTPVMAALEGHQGMELSPLILNPGQLVLPEYMRPTPDALVFVVDEEWRRGIWETINHIPSPRPPLFIVSQINDMELMRLAMRDGVRDLFPPPCRWTTSLPPSPGWCRKSASARERPGPGSSPS